MLKLLNPRLKKFFAPLGGRAPGSGSACSTALTVANLSFNFVDRFQDGTLGQDHDHGRGRGRG